MSIGDFFKPIWKNSNPEVRLKHLLHISQTDKYRHNDPGTLKIIKSLSVNDSDQRVVDLAISLLHDPNDFNEILNEAKSATAKNSITKMIEKNFRGKIKDLDAGTLRKFLGIFKNQDLIKEIIFQEPQLWQAGVEKINDEDVLGEMFVYCVRTPSLEKELPSLIDQVQSYSVLKKMLQAYQAGHPHPDLLATLKKKISLLPEYQEDIEFTQLKQKKINLATSLQENIQTLKEKNQKKDFSSTSLKSPDCFSQEWEALKWIPETLDDEKNFQNKLEEFTTVFAEWQQNKAQHDHAHSLATELIKIAQSFDALIPQEVDFRSEWIDLESFEKYINSLNDLAEEKFRQAEDLIATFPENIYTLPIISHSRDEFIAKKNRVTLHLEKNRDRLLKKRDALLHAQEAFRSITEELQSFLVRCDQVSPETLQPELSTIRNRWEEMKERVKPFPPELFQELENNFDKCSSRCTQKINERIQRKVIEHKQFISQLQQEIKTKTDTIRSEVEKLEADPKSNPLYPKGTYVEFLKSLEPYREEIDKEILDEFQEQLVVLNKKFQEIEENINREQAINLEKRLKLCSVLEELAEEGDKEKLVHLVKEAQNKWHKLGTVSKKDFFELNRRFTNICETILANCGEAVKSVEEEIEREINRKKKLMAELTDINSHSSQYTEMDWKKFSTTINEIINEWKKIKILSEKENLKLNLHFKELLDIFYRQRNEFFHTMKQKRMEKMGEKKALLQELTSLKEKSSANKDLNWISLKKQLLHLSSQWQKIGIAYPFSENKELDHNFYQIYEEILSHNHEGMEIRIQKKERLWSEINDIQKAIQENLTPDHIREQIKKLFSVKHDWDRIAPIPARKYRNLNSGFYTLYKNILEKHSSSVKEIQEESKQNLEKKQGLLQQLEATLDQNHDADTTQKVIEIQKEWKSIGPIPSKMYSLVEKPFYQKTSLFFRQRRDDYQNIKNKRQENYNKKQEILTRMRYLLQSHTKKTQPDVQSLMDSPDKLKIIWEMNRQMGSHGEHTQRKKIHEEIRNLKNQWNEIGSAFSERKLNDEFYGLLRSYKS